MNSNQIGFSDEFTYNNNPIKYEITQEGTLQLYVEDCARALGVTKNKERKDGTPYKIVRYDEVYEDLVAIEKVRDVGLYKNLDKDTKASLRKEMKSMTIGETDLYLWSFRVDSEQGKLFREWLATTVLPNLRKYGIYINGMEDMSPEDIKRVADERVERYVLRKYGINIRRNLTDAIKQVLNPSPSQSYIYAKYTNLLYKALFGMECKQYKESLGLSEKDSLRDKVDSETLNTISKAEDFMSNLMMSGISDLIMLETMMNNWNINYKKINNKLIS